MNMDTAEPSDPVVAKRFRIDLAVLNNHPSLKPSSALPFNPAEEPLDCAMASLPLEIIESIFLRSDRLSCANLALSCSALWTISLSSSLRARWLLEHCSDAFGECALESLRINATKIFPASLLSDSTCTTFMKLLLHRRQVLLVKSHTIQVSGYLSSIPRIDNMLISIWHFVTKVAQVDSASFLLSHFIGSNLNPAIMNSLDILPTWLGSGLSNSIRHNNVDLAINLLQVINRVLPGRGWDQGGRGLLIEAVESDNPEIISYLLANCKYLLSPGPARLKDMLAHAVRTKKWKVFEKFSKLLPNTALIEAISESVISDAAAGNLETMQRFVDNVAVLKDTEADENADEKSAVVVGVKERVDLVLKNAIIAAADNGCIDVVLYLWKLVPLDDTIIARIVGCTIALGLMKVMHAIKAHPVVKGIIISQSDVVLKSVILRGDVEMFTTVLEIWRESSPALIEWDMILRKAVEFSQWELVKYLLSTGKIQNWEKCLCGSRVWKFMSKKKRNQIWEDLSTSFSNDWKFDVTPDGKLNSSVPPSQTDFSIQFVDLRSYTNFVFEATPEPAMCPCQQHATSTRKSPFKKPHKNTTTFIIDFNKTIKSEIAEQSTPEIDNTNDSILAVPEPQIRSGSIESVIRLQMHAKRNRGIIRGIFHVIRGVLTAFNLYRTNPSSSNSSSSSSNSISGAQKLKARLKEIVVK